MQEWGQEFRAWLMSLDERGMRRLLTYHQCLRRRNCDAHRRRVRDPKGVPGVSRREVHSARVWLTTASESNLLGVSACGVAWAAHVLDSFYGFPRSVVRDPTDSQLSLMFKVLEPPLARCALYGLLRPGVKGQPAAAIAVVNRERLTLFAEREPPPNAREIGPALADESGTVERESEQEGRAAEMGEEKADPEMAAATDSSKEGACSDTAGTDEARGVLAELRSGGAELVQALRGVAAEVAEGKAPEETQTVGAQLSAWVHARALLAQSVAVQGVRWPAGEGYEELDAELDRIDALRVERARRAGQLAKLRQRAAQYEQWIADAEGEAEAEGLRMALDGILDRISALEGVDEGAAPRQATPTSASGQVTQVPDATESRDAMSQDVASPSSASTEAATCGQARESSEEQGPSEGTPGESAQRPERENRPQPSTEPTSALSAQQRTVSPTQGQTRAQDHAQGQDRNRAHRPVQTERESLGTEPTADEESAALTAPPTDALAEPASGEPVDMPHRAVDLTLPWSTGERVPPVVELVGHGRMAHAYWMTEASDESAARAKALAFTAAAFACVDVDGATQAQMEYDFAAAELVEDREAHLVATVAALRAGLTAGWPHALVSDFSMPAGLSVPWQDLLTVLVTAVRECQTFVPGAVDDSLETEHRPTTKDIEESARVLLEDLPRRKIKYQRASRVLQYLTGPSGQLNQALRVVLQWARSNNDDGAALRAISDDLCRGERADWLIEDADSRFRTPKQAREPIHSGALRQLQTTIRSVAELVTKAEAMAAADRARKAASGTQVPQLEAAVLEVASYDVPAGVGGAALGLLRTWLTGEFVGTGESLVKPDNALLPSEDCLLFVPQLPRDADGRPDLADPRTAHSMTGLLTPASPDTALDDYLSRGDLHLARALARAVERRVTSDPDTGRDWQEDATRRCREAEKTWRRKIAERHGVAASHLAQIRTLNLMQPDTEREFTGRLQEFADGDEQGRCRYALEALRELVAELTKLVAESTKLLRDRLDALRLDPERPLSEPDHDRILRLIDEGDTVTAQEFLALTESSQRLPDGPDDEGVELREFLQGLTGPAAPAPGGDGVPAGWWADRFGSGTKLTRNAEDGLASWKALCTKKGRNSDWSHHLPKVLRLLGLKPVAPFQAERMGQGVRRFKGRASVTEGAGYVAALGSRATSYTIVLIWEEQRAEGPLAHLEDADVDANIVIYLHPLGLEGRRTLTEVARRRAQQALVVDPAVFGWMAARTPGAFRALQRVTLPWAAYDPYTPFVAGAVPPEVFYGRDKELREVMNPEGGLFLYGGRQLGKSALLRRVAELFPSHSESNVAVYLDLVKAEIGQAESPERIWNLLAEDLKRQRVIDSKRVSDHAGPDVVAREIRSWLDAHDSRRLLILADEADAFLTADSRRVFRSGGESTFQNVKRFQHLMEQTDRRLKVVFAGLHQVQRFGELSNVSTAHGGPDVLVGPLNPTAAVRLVTEPMTALGFVFERPELVWRILAITNYQANLVQIFCSELVQTLQERAQRGHARPTLITEADVQEVAGSDTVRTRLAERLRFTINLEDRYRVLTLVIALRSLANGYRGDYSAEELLRWAGEAWPAGFQGLGVKQVQIYLKEMVGLGLLVQLGDRSRFAVRSPNVVNMLGTREELELELRETEFSQPYEYDPRAARRLLGRDSLSNAQQFVTRYSPLTEGQLHEAAQPGVTVIGTTRLYRPELMIVAAGKFAEARGVEVRGLSAQEDLRVALAAASRLRRNYVLTVDLRGAAAPALIDAVDACAQHAGPAADSHIRQAEGRKRSGHRSVLVVADALTVGDLRDLREEDQPAVRFLHPERWTVESLRAWPECPFVSRAERSRLIQVTGGWASWVELAIADVVKRGATLDNALDSVSRTIQKRDNLDKHCEWAGLERRDLDLLGMWNGYVNEAQGVPIDDVAAAVELSEQDAKAWLIRLDRLGIVDEADDGITVDPVTFRAVRARFSGA
ncbi:hypothetical protein [Streptomyces sp. RK9]|uniref:hypothetical protein n=1 Tax=Streptomyces sp. RK9 TaxID=3239284 RepID=UPI00386A60C1